MPSLWFVFVAFVAVCGAYDTGVHEDLTRLSMRTYGFGANAIDATIAANYYTDFYSWVDTEDYTPQLQTLHFDSLNNGEQLVYQWKRFSDNAATQFRRVVAEGRVLDGILVLGATLHAVQDFYTHSDWPELFPRGDKGQTDCVCLRDETITSLSEADLLALGNKAFTGTSSTDGFQIEVDLTGRYLEGEPGEHGSYCGGVNHDSYDRPNYQESFAFGYAGSVEWIAAVETWVNSTSFFSAMRSYGTTPALTPAERQALTDDLEVGENLIARAKLPDQDGHYKGSGSGDAAKAARDLAAFLAKPKTWFHEAFIAACQPGGPIQSLGFEMYNFGATVPPAWPPFAPYRLQDSAVLLRTVSAAKASPAGLNFFAATTIDGVVVRDSPQPDTEEDELDKLRWTSIVFVPSSTTTVPIVYQLHSGDLEDARAPFLTATMTYSLADSTLTGDIEGTHSSLATAVTYLSGGEGVATFYVTTVPTCTGPPPVDVAEDPDLDQNTKAQCEPTPVVPYCLLSEAEQAADFAKDLWGVWFGVTLALCALCVGIGCCCHISNMRAAEKTHEYDL